MLSELLSFTIAHRNAEEVPGYRFAGLVVIVNILSTMNSRPMSSRFGFQVDAVLIVLFQLTHRVVRVEIFVVGKVGTEGVTLSLPVMIGEFPS